MEETDAKNLAIAFVESGAPFGHATAHKTDCIRDRRGCCGCWPWNLSGRMEKKVVDN